ncbi:DUF3857 domain-containing protein [Flavobacterium sp. Root186]|uniref:DUF3857 domain-containing protein n=1 Tax=Flavobacterium sp. Root186 TaxID=1736485 RepID=UPI0006FB15D7|nr:DUF3857 domain-containing protein [Flavobacterium sp. Root186]KRB53850.1 hypothetical protein ASD98_19660 [Flavobacterium sp. Root186]
MKISSSVFILFFLFIVKVQSQNYELGKVTIAELEEKMHPKDSSASAAILFKKGRTFFTHSPSAGFVSNNVYEIKIKIYKKGGLSWANQKVPYYVGYDGLNDDTVKFSDAVTYNLENGVIVKTPLKSEGSFKAKKNKYWNEASITFPNVKEGSIIEFKYILKTEMLVRLPDFDFQFNIPVNYAEYKTEIPEFYIYKTLLIGFNKIENESHLTENKEIYGVTYKVANNTYKAYNIPALFEENYIDNINNYLSSIHNELQGKRLQNMPFIESADPWQDVVNIIYKSESFGNELKEKEFLAEDVERLVTNVESQKEKLDIIFNFLQNKMNWNGEKGYHTDKGVIKAYKDQIGNVAEINFILINMLKIAGIEANPVLVSTIENGIPVYPTKTGFNYVIASAEIDGKQILLDAAHKLASPDILPLNLLNWKGRLIKKDGTSQEIDLIPVNLSKEYTNVLVKMDDSGKMNGKARIQRANYEAYGFRVENDNKNEETYLEKLEEELGNLKISDYKIENKKTNLAEPVLETFSFTAENQSEIINDKIFLNPLLFLTKTKNPFNQEKRVLPIYFGYPSEEEIIINLEIPAGYKIESMPKPIQISSENKEIVFVLDIVNVDDRIQISCSKVIKNSVFEADQYNGLKNLYQKMLANQNEKIVLKRI